MPLISTSCTSALDVLSSVIPSIGYCQMDSKALGSLADHPRAQIAPLGRHRWDSKRFCPGTGLDSSSCTSNSVESSFQGPDKGALEVELQVFSPLQRPDAQLEASPCALSSAPCSSSFAW